jgi:hypothetical protein
MEYPSNSQRKPPSEGAPKPQEKKIERIVEGEVKRRKKSPGKRFAETFMGGDARSVGGYVMFDVLIPALRDTVVDTFSTGIERLIYGEGRSSRRGSSSYRSAGPGGYVAYNRYAPTRPYRNEREEPRNISRRARSTHDFDEIILGTRVEAEEVVERLFDLVDRYEQASVADLYELVGINPNHTDDKWGWTDVRGSRVERTRNGYLLNLPKPEPLER